MMLKIDRRDAQTEMMHLVHQLCKPIKDLPSMAHFIRDFCQRVRADEQLDLPFNPSYLIRRLFLTKKDTTRASIREVFRELSQSQQAAVLRALCEHAMIEI